MNYNTLQFTQSENLYDYQLTHLYQTNGQTRYFTTFITPEIMKPLLAYIEFYAEEHIDESWSIGYNTIVQTIQNYYSPVYEYKPEYKDYTDQLHTIDQYYNRESFTGTGLHKNTNFQRHMKNFLTKLINQEKLHNQQSEGENAFNTLDPNYIA